MVHDPLNDVEFFFLRPKDIATYVGTGTPGPGHRRAGHADRGRKPRSGSVGARFRRVNFPAGRAGGQPTDVASLSGRRIATSYAGLLGGWLTRQGIDARVVKLDGAVENAVRLGVADAIADVVDTGTTLRLAGLQVIGEPLLNSQAVLLKSPREVDDAAVETFVRRLHGVIVARTYVLVDYDIPADLVDAACAVTPGLESPTVSPLRDSAWVAIRAMVPRAAVHAVMDDVYELGGRGILVTDIHACRL